MFDEMAGRPRLAAEASQWFLSADERGNANAVLDHRHRDGLAWSRGNQVRPLVHGAEYFAELFSAVEAMEAGDRLMFTDWRGAPDEMLWGPVTEVSPVFATGGPQGVDVRGLVWRSHQDRLRFSA